MRGWGKDEESKEGGEKVRTGRRRRVEGCCLVLGFILVELHWIS